MDNTFDTDKDFEEWWKLILTRFILGEIDIRQPREVAQAAWDACTLLHKKTVGV